MSSRRGGRGGRGGRELPREVMVSKKISWLLRHGAEQEGLKLRDGGYVNVADAVSIELKDGSPLQAFLTLLISFLQCYPKTRFLFFSFFAGHVLPVSPHIKSMFPKLDHLL
jgi:RNA:NAD 2'-phosphotransferase (TPT1/KptA family)